MSRYHIIIVKRCYEGKVYQHIMIVGKGSYNTRVIVSFERDEIIKVRLKNAPFVRR